MVDTHDVLKYLSATTDLTPEKFAEVWPDTLDEQIALIGIVVANGAVRDSQTAKRAEASWALGMLLAGVTMGTLLMHLSSDLMTAGLGGIISTFLTFAVGKALKI